MSHFVKNLGKNNNSGSRNNSGQESEIPLFSLPVACACVRTPIAPVQRLVRSWSLRWGGSSRLRIPLWSYWAHTTWSQDASESTRISVKSYELTILAIRRKPCSHTCLTENLGLDKLTAKDKLQCKLTAKTGDNHSFARLFIAVSRQLYQGKVFYDAWFTDRLECGTHTHICQSSARSAGWCDGYVTLALYIIVHLLRVIVYDAVDVFAEEFVEFL